MVNLTNYIELKDGLAGQSYRFTQKFEYLEKIITKDKVTKSYAKKFFKNVKEVEAYFITSEKIINVRFEPLIIKTYNIQDIKNIEIEMPNIYEISLKIYFDDINIIELNNKKDSDEDWENRYYDYIVDLSNYLVNLKSS